MCVCVCMCVSVCDDIGELGEYSYQLAYIMNYSYLLVSQP